MPADIRVMEPSKSDPFVIAHEVARYLLGHQIPSEGILVADAAAPFSVYQAPEADVFASEPEDWVALLCTVALCSRLLGYNDPAIQPSAARRNKRDSCRCDRVFVPRASSDGF